MERLTRRIDQGIQVEPLMMERALERLVDFEDAVEEAEAKQEALSRQLEELRMEGKSKSARFRELMGEKLLNTRFLSVFQARGIR